jgi:hypothetical protein
MLLWRGRQALARGWWAGLIGFGIGSAPFWLYNFSHDFATFTQIFGATNYTPTDFGAIANHLLRDLLPRLMSGAAEWGSGGLRWQIIPLLIYPAGLIALLATLRFWPQESGKHLRWMLALFVLAVPALYLVSGYGQTAFNPWGVDATGRYVLMLHSVLPIGVAVLAGMLLRKRVVQVMGVLLIAAVLGANLLGRILAADYYDTYLADGFLRFPDALAAVEAAERAAFVVPVLPNQQELPIQRALDAAGVVYNAVDVLPTLRVYVPETYLNPNRIAAGLGYQY